MPLEPPYPGDTRAKGWRFELDLERVAQSDTWALAHPEVRPWLLMLWAVAWQQTPCGSLPAEPALIAARIGAPARFFEKHREVLLRGWKEASDGRLYHPVVTERVLEMVGYRDKAATRKAEYRARMQESHKSPESVPRDSTVKNDTGTGTGTGTKEKKKPTASSAAPTVPCPYDRIVALYHDRLPGLPAVRLMDDKRQRAMRKVWAWVLSSTRSSDGKRRATTAEEALAWFGGYFERASENDFLMGRGPRSAEHANWRCDLDFLLTDRGMKHVIEKTQEAA